MSDSNPTNKKENFSRKRIAILKTLQETAVHPTAEWIYEQLKPKYQNLSLGTVYRNLKSFCSSGRAVSVGVINGQEHFDADLSPHAHLICEKCGAILDVKEPFFRSQDLLKLSMEHGLTFQSVKITFHGLCEKCSDADENAESA